MKINNVLKLVFCIAVSELAGVIGSFFTMPSIPNWYAALEKPALNPPAWVFAPVWTALFALMGIAAFFIWMQGIERRDVKIALVIFGGQLALNILWSVLFFGKHNPGAAFVEIIFLWLAIAVMIFVFSKISRLAAWLLVPYILWVSFAGYLNYSIWQSYKILPKVPDNFYKDVVCAQDAKLCPDGSYVSRIGQNCDFEACPNNEK